MNSLVWILLGGGAAYLYKLKRAGDKISMTVQSITKVTTSGGAITVYINIAIDNPANINIKIKRPSIKIFVDEVERGNSIPDDEMITIEKNKRTIINVNVQIPILSLTSELFDLLQNGLKGKKIKVIATTTANGLPYKSEKTFDL